MTTVLLAAMTLLSFWVGRAFDSIDRRFDSMSGDINSRFDRRFDGMSGDINSRFDRLEQRFERMEDVVLRDHGERIARLEANP